MSASLIATARLVKSYRTDAGEIPVLCDVARGEMLAITGASG